MEYNLFLQHFLESDGITTDTRSQLKGKIFFALKGANFNGNTFALDAIKQGAIAVVVDEPIEHSENSDQIISVGDVLAYLQGFAEFYRSHLNTFVVGLTGSNGKTTTKELLLAILEQKFKVQATKGNLNNHIGVPLTLLELKKETEISIVEMGANHPMEIDFLSKIAKPNIGLITNIGKAHLEGFGSIENIDTSKRELFDFLENNKGVCYINTDDPYLKASIEKYTEPILYGDNSKFSITHVRSSSSPMLKAILKVEDEEIIIHTNLIGAFNAPNLLAAATVAYNQGMSLNEIKTGIENYYPSNSRSQLKETENNQVIVDAYNANPTSMILAIKNLGSLNIPLKFAIIGEMREVGTDAQKEHEKVANLLQDLKISHIFIGKSFQTIRNGYTQAYFPSIDEAENTPQLFGNLKNRLILLKGSRGVALERLLPYL